MATPTTIVIGIAKETRDRLYQMKGPGRTDTYDSVIRRALDALEEKKTEPRSQPGNNETGKTSQEARTRSSW